MSLPPLCGFERPRNSNYGGRFVTLRSIEYDPITIVRSRMGLI